MNSIPQAVKSHVNSSGKIALNAGSSTGGTPTFTVKQLPSNNKVGTVTVGHTANTISTPAAFIKLNHATAATTAGASGVNQNATLSSTQLNTAAKIQIQPGVATTGGSGPIFSMTVNPPLLNAAATATGGVKRKAEQMENHN